MRGAAAISEHLDTRTASIEVAELLADAMQVDPGFVTGNGVRDDRAAPSNEGHFKLEVGSTPVQPAK